MAKVLCHWCFCISVTGISSVVGIGRVALLEIMLEVFWWVCGNLQPEQLPRLNNVLFGDVT